MEPVDPETSDSLSIEALELRNQVLSEENAELKRRLEAVRVDYMKLAASVRRALQTAGESIAKFDQAALRPSAGKSRRGSGD